MNNKRNKSVWVNNVPTYSESHTRDQNEIVELVWKAIKGDSGAFSKLYIIYIEPIYRYIFYQVKDKTTAEDITQEAFFKAWNSLHSCKGRERTFPSWLYQIAHTFLPR